MIMFFTFQTALPAQQPWKYIAGADIKFPLADSLVTPYLCATDNQDNLWVISSSTSAPGAVNALFKAAPGDTVFTLIDDYRSNLNVESARGITTIDDTVFVICRKPDKQTSIMLEYPDSDPNAMIEYTAGGYGTWVMGLSANDDKYIYAGISYLTSIRVYDFTDTSASRSSWVPILPLDQHPNEPGGHYGAELTSKIRDVAVIPGADYSDPATPFFSSRESDTTGQKGGIAIWSGGTQYDPKNYSGQRVSDVASDLSWLWWTPYGITCDAQGNLYACGTDTNRSWVKSFSIYGTLAVENEEFPAMYSKSTPDPQGAPLVSPTDIALSRDENQAWVIDMEEKRAFLFSRDYTAIEENSMPLVNHYQLLRNYPNPFNGQTKLVYEIAEGGQVDLTIYDILGKKITTLVNDFRTAGRHSVVFNARDLSSGIYFAVLNSDKGATINKLIYAK